MRSVAVCNSSYLHFTPRMLRNIPFPFNKKHFEALVISSGPQLQFAIIREGGFTMGVADLTRWSLG